MGRPDGVAISEALKIVYILEFKQSTDRDEGFQEVKDAEANSLLQYVKETIN